jgi:hypothetical protein
MKTRLAPFFALCAASVLAACGDLAVTEDEPAAADAPAEPEIYEDGPAPDVSSFTAALSTSLIHEHFNYDKPLITNEYATYNPTHSGIVTSPLWKVTSGSLFHSSGTGWTGRPDDIAPDRTSSNGNHSVVFRMVSKRADIGNASITVTIKNAGFVTSRSTPAQAYDGVHLFLRYQSEENLYAVTLNRRDGTMVVKKKIPGGPSNGGTYFTLTPTVAYAVPRGSWQTFVATIRTQSNGSVKIEVKNGDGKILLSAVDDGRLGGAPIVKSGRVGVRGDNTSFQMGRVIATAL